MKFDMFCDKFEKFINQTDEGLKRFVFEIYDTKNNDKLTEESLFKFMSIMTRKLPNLN